MGVRKEKCNDGQDIFETVTIPTENVGSTGHDWQYGGVESFLSMDKSQL